MKILHVNNNFHFVGGTEQYLHSICSELNSLGHRNAVMYDKAHADDHADAVENRYIIPSLDDFNGRLRGEVASRVESVVKKEKPDVIYLHNIHNPDAVQLLAELAPVAKFVHDHEFYCPKGIRILNDRLCRNSKSLICMVNALRGNGYRCMGGRSEPGMIVKKSRQLVLNKRAHHKIKRFIVASHHMKNNLISLGYETDRIRVIPYFTDIPDGATQANEQHNILFAGRLSPEKGLDTFIDILALVKTDFRCVIIGDGPSHYVSMLRERVREKGLDRNVEFLGWVDNKNLGKYYEEAAFLAVPSVWPEPFGIVGIEAMSHSRPVISFDVGGIPEWLEDNKTGFLVERNNIKEFAGRMELLLRDKALRNRLGRNAYERASEIFNKPRHVQTLISVLNEIIVRQN